MDIVERLRQRKERIIAANPSGIISMADSDALEAADEIERLREALRKIADATHSDWFSMKETARAALKGDE